MSYAIETLNLTKHFTQTNGFASLFTHPFKPRNAVKAVENVNIQVKEGELFGLLGPNGAGKTTLLKLLSTLILPTQGTAYINSYNVVTEEEKVKSFIGLVTGEERSFYWRLTGRQNLEFFAVLHNLPATEVKIRVDEVAYLLEVTEQLNNRFQGYSTGVKQRMAIARGLLNNPQVLLIDEPTKSLDPTAAKDLRTFIKEELVGRQKKTVLFTTHQLSEAENLCDRIAIMDQGRIRACGTLDKLRGVVDSPEATLDEIFIKLTEGSDKNVESAQSVV